MEDKLEPNSEINNKTSDNTNKLNTEEKKELNPEKVVNMNEKNETSDNTNKLNTEEKKELNPEKVANMNEKIAISPNNSAPKVDIKKENDTPAKTIPKPKKELPIEKKPFQEFINIHLIPALIDEINQRGLEIININLENTNRPIAGDKCWVINCEIKDTCNFWLSFEKDDISSLKSISLSKPKQKPSIIESFLIDEKRITLKLIISRVLQRLNGQKLIGVN